MNDRKLLLIVSSITITLIVFITLSIYFKLNKRESITFENISGFREVNNKMQKVSCQNMKINNIITNDSLFFDLNGVMKFGYKIIQRTSSVIYVEDKNTVIKLIYEKKDNQTLLFFKPSNQLIIVLSSSQLNCN